MSTFNLFLKRYFYFADLTVTFVLVLVLELLMSRPTLLLSQMLNVKRDYLYSAFS